MGTLSLTVPLMPVNRSRQHGGTGFTFFLLSFRIQYIYTTKQLHIVTLISFAFSTQCRYTSPYLTCSAQEVHESKIGHVNAVYSHYAEPETQKIQWVGITHTYTHTHTRARAHTCPLSCPQYVKTYSTSLHTRCSISTVCTSLL